MDLGHSEMTEGEPTHQHSRMEHRRFEVSGRSAAVGVAVVVAAAAKDPHPGEEEWSPVARVLDQ